LIAKILYEKVKSGFPLMEPMVRILCRSAVGFFLTVAVFAQAGQAAVIYSTVDKRQLSVGDRVYLTVTLMVPKGASVTPPDPAGSFGALTVKEWNSRKSSLAKADSIAFDYAVTTYKAENCTIPSLPYVLENGTHYDTLKTESIPLTVIPLCRSDSADIMGLKPQQVTGKRPLLWLWLLLASGGAIAAVLTTGYYIRKRKKPPPPPPPRPPYEEAADSLDALDAKQYLLKGMVREYVFELSEILKRYIERRFYVNAAEFTTEEMLAWLGISPLDKERKNSMEWFFRAADPVKFARFLPERDTVGRFGPEVRGFIEATKPPPDAVTTRTSGAQPAAPAAAPEKAEGGAR
jgi:hypothetical protein